MLDSFSHIITKIAYFKEINRVLPASSKNRNALSNSGTLQVILHVSKDKDFSTRCSTRRQEKLCEKRFLARYVKFHKETKNGSMQTCLLISKRSAVLIHWKLIAKLYISDLRNFLFANIQSSYILKSEKSGCSLFTVNRLEPFDTCVQLNEKDVFDLSTQIFVLHNISGQK